MVNYRRVYIKAGTTILALFALLIALSGAKITSNGDISCFGTLEDPCISYINITTNVTTYIYNKGDFKLDFSPSVKDYMLCIRDNRYSAKSRLNRTNYPCGRYYKPINFTEHPSKDRIYNFKFVKGKTYQFSLIGYKHNPTDLIKWTIYGAGSELDPLLKPVTTDSLFSELIYNNPKTREAIFNLNNIKSNKLSKNSLNFLFNEVCGKVKSYDILSLQTVQNINGSQQEYLPITDIYSGLNNIKIRANIEKENCSDGTYGYKIDWVPTINLVGINYTQNKWAWWNDTIMVNTNCIVNEWIDLDNGSSTVGYDTSGSIRLGFPLEDNLSAYWNMDTNGSIPDETCVNDGVNNSITFISSGKINGAYECDGAASFINVGTDTSLDIVTNQLAMTAYILPDNTTGTKRIISAPLSETGGTLKYQLLLDTNKIQCIITTGGGVVVSEFAYTDTTNWGFIVCTYDGVNMRLYVNGELRDTDAQTGNIVAISDGNINLCRFGPTFGQYYDGDIDEIHIYNKNLSTAMILAMNNSGNGLVYNITNNEFHSKINNTGSVINWIVPTLNITGNGFNVSYRVSTDNRSTFTNYLTDANNSENISVARGQWLSFDFNLSGNATNSPTIENFRMLSGFDEKNINVTYCSGQNDNYSFDYNISNYNWSSGTLTEYNISVLNLDECLFNLINNGASVSNFSIKTNVTSTQHNMTCIGNNTIVLNTSCQLLWIDVLINESKPTNCTADYIQANSTDVPFEVSFCVS